MEDVDPNTPMGGAVATGALRRHADGSYIAYSGNASTEQTCSYDAYCLSFAEWVQREYPESWARWIAGPLSKDP